MNKGSAIEINHLSVDYSIPFSFFKVKHAFRPGQIHARGRFRALHDINLQIRPGEHVGVVGMNGAGKTTLFRTLAGVINPADGNVTIDGRSAASPDRSVTGYMAPFPLVYRQLTGYENLRFVANLYRVNQYESRIKKLAELIGLTDVLDMYVEQYSTGMAARLDFARVLLPDPSLLILDEPFGSFDIHFAEVARKIIKDSSATIILATHNLEDIENLTDRLVLLHKGELTRDISFTDLSEVAPTHVGKKTLSIIEFTDALLKRTAVAERGYREPIHRKYVLSK